MKTNHDSQIGKFILLYVCWVDMCCGYSSMRFFAFNWAIAICLVQQIVDNSTADCNAGRSVCGSELRVYL